ncbi:sigma-54-dependent transcriptional regulator [Crateriforma conspicua]|uniref:DNA-binding transcriptional regulator NtrC n=1 Tax=Crateriforma conspicua TaxID=2527996 RepID=A0A5C5Y9G8_9PLAN|nr:sigma-54 dependent transcriptional regulator [Crateriforma conspicua]QDV65566.1 Nitrogen assimilation regulatory protein [Crateriforma conspicua]TWT70965.1 Nitrogen assimilation regulatory protein [Crateriforma conspicua]
MTTNDSGNAPADVLVVDDEPSICWAFQRMLEEQGHHVRTASSAEEGLELASDRAPDLILLDVRLPKEDGISALPKFRSVTNEAPVVIMTAFGDLDTAVAAVRQGASDYLVKPFRLEDARRVCKNALRRPAVTSASVTSPTASGANDIVGVSAAIQHVFRQIALVASSDLSVLITGETGTGKELVAAAIHKHSDRADKPYLPIAPVALNEDLIESELFGHVKGAFTGATDDRQGLFERAEGGTILLDEIGDLPMHIQVKLLRVLEQREYFRVGDVTPRRCNVRLLAATNADLGHAVRENRFREDLFYRLNGLHIHLPPLRQRREDVAPLVQHFLRLAGHADPASLVSDDLIVDLQNRLWEGNVRELRNAVERAAVVARGRRLSVDDFPVASSRHDLSPTDDRPFDLAAHVDSWVRDALSDGHRSDLLARLHAEVEKPLIRILMQRTGQNRAKTAEMLGIHRGTLREKIRSYGLESDPTPEP